MTLKPEIKPAKTFINGKIEEWKGETKKIYSPITCEGKKVQIGLQAVMKEEDSLKALDAAFNSWNYGRGEWAQLSIKDRIEKVREFVNAMKEEKTQKEIEKYLQWEICKNTDDAKKEFTRTMDYIENTIKVIPEESELKESGLSAKLSRAPLGIVVIVGPFNYPFNETYCMLIPSLLMGNSVVMKLPNVGGLAHIASMEHFAKHFPPGVVNFVTGSGRVTLPPLMRTGKVDVLGFIGSHNGANALMKAHPHPHRLTHVLGLGAKNPAIVMNNLNDEELKNAAEQCALGSTSYNGQRCTALKLIFVHEDIKTAFLEKFIQEVDSKKIGLPWTPGAQITPLPEPNKPDDIEDLIEDAKSKGASILNPKRGGQRAYAILPPTILEPVKENMRLWEEEQFGPVIPIVPFTDYNWVIEKIAKSNFGQQASVFTKFKPQGDYKTDLDEIVNNLKNMVARVNINQQCRRSPDTFPFTGRKSSARGTLSVKDALTIFSLPSLVSSPTKFSQ